MSYMSNAYAEKTLLDELNILIKEVFETTKKAINKHHWILGYF